MGTVTALHPGAGRARRQAVSLAEAGMEIGEAGRVIGDLLVPLARANAWLANYLRPAITAAERCESEGRRLAGLGAAGECADHIRRPGHGRSA